MRVECTWYWGVVAGIALDADEDARSLFVVLPLVAIAVIWRKG